jgi:hypothetical protein
MLTLCGLAQRHVAGTFHDGHDGHDKVLGASKMCSTAGYCAVERVSEQICARDGGHELNMVVERAESGAISAKSDNNSGRVCFHCQ